MPDVEWATLVDYLAAESTDLVLLGEMPFSRWLAATNRTDPAAWHSAIDDHDAWIAHLTELSAVAVAGSRPVLRSGVPHNEAFIWSAAAGYRPIHLNYYLPDEPGFWEATWYRRSPEKSFRAARLEGTSELGDVSFGFMICTDMWFTEHARGYAAQGAELLLIPRATELQTGANWLAGGRAAAVMAGAFCLSSNRRGTGEGLLWGGAGWIVDSEGSVLVTTTDQDPFVTLDIDLRSPRRQEDLPQIRPGVTGPGSPLSLR